MESDRILRVVQKYYKDPTFDVNLMADKLQISPSHLRDIVRVQLGLTPKALLDTYRVIQVVRALSEVNDMSAICKLTGYACFKTFVRTFRKKTGTTPQSWKKHLCASSQPEECIRQMVERLGGTYYIS